MAKEVKAGTASIDFRVKRDQIKNDLNSIKSDVQKKVTEIESVSNRIRMRFDDKVAKMSLAQVERYYAKLKKEMERKIEINASDASLDFTLIKMDAARKRIKDIGLESERTTKKIGDGFKRIGAYILTYFGVRNIGRFIEDSTKLYAVQTELESGFKGSSREINLFAKATSDALSRADLIKLSNQATDLGVSLEDQAVFFLLAKRAVSEYGGSVEQNFQRIVTASEGELEGVKKVGIQQKVYQMRIRELAKEHGALIENLDAETQKRIRLKAILEASRLTIKDVENKQMSFNEQIQAVPSLIDDIKASFGGFFSKLLIDWLPNGIESLKDFNRRLRELTLGRGNVAAEGVTYDFSGTSEKDRAELIAVWYQKIAEEISRASAAKTKFVNYEMSNEDLEQIAIDVEIAISTYKKLIELAKKYKEEKKDPTKIIKPFKESSEQKEAFDYKYYQKLKEKSIEDYYNAVKFQDEEYFQWKTEQYIRDYYAAVQAGADKYQQEVLLNEKIKALLEERSKYDQTDLSLRGQTPEDVYNKSEGRTNWREKARRNREREKDQLDKNKESAEQFADVLSSGLTQGIISGENLGKVLANLGIQLAGMVAQAILFKTIMSALGLSGADSIGGSILSIFGLAKGGTVTNTGSGVSYSPHRKAAFGMNNFTVPGGYYKDNFLIGVQTGERVKVTPANQRDSESLSNTAVLNKLSRLETAIARMDANNMSKGGGMNIVNWQVGGRTLATILIKEMNQMSREGINLGEL